MRLILRAQTHQSRLEDRPDGDDDDRREVYAVVVDGPKIGRIYREIGGSSKGNWYWFLQTDPYGKGITDTLDEAKDESAKGWHLASGQRIQS